MSYKTERNKAHLEGTFDVGILDQYNPDTKRGSVRSVELGTSQSISMADLPFGNSLPLEGSLVAVYRQSDFDTRYLFTIANPPRDNEDFPAPDVLDDETIIDSSYVMEPGECFFGSNATLFMNKVGSATLKNRVGNLKLELNNINAKATLLADNFSLATPGKGIHVFTESSVPSTFGDTFKIERNIPLPEIPEEISGSLPTPTTLSRIELDPLGRLTLSSLPGTAVMDMSVLGNISISNPLSSVTMSPAGAVEMDGITVDIEAVTSFVATAPSSTVIGSAEAALEGALIRLGAVATDHVGMAEPISAVINALIAFQTVVKVHTHIVPGVTPGPGATIASPSIELGAAPIEPATTPASIGSTTVSVQA